ncbi:MAG: hypothetical protein ACI4TI_00695 [Christensenellales bacterium]
MIDKKVIKSLLISILFSVMLPAGIVGIVFGATNHLETLFVLAIIMCVLGFYGTPLMWIHFGSLKAKQNICKQIKLDNIQEIEKLATINNKKFEEMLSIINSLISKRYLTGYEVIEKKYVVKAQHKMLSKTEILEQNGNIKIVVCQSCGAKNKIVGKGKVVCPYCDNVVISK